MPRGDVLLVDLPPPLSSGRHEQAGRRPAIAVQTDSTSGASSVLMIVPVTSKLTALRFPHTLRIDPSNTNGLQQPSVMLVGQLRAVGRRRIVGSIGRLESQYMASLDAELRKLLDL